MAELAEMVDVWDRIDAARHEQVLEVARTLLGWRERYGDGD